MKLNKSSSFFILILSILFTFNVYYFFINRNVTPFFYIKKYTSTPKDTIMESSLYNDLREEYFNFNNITSDSKIVFIGDSITKRFNINEFSRNNKIINRGIFSDTTYGLLNRLGSNVNNLRIEKLFILIGYNDLDFRSNDDITDNIMDFVKNAKVNKIYVQSLLPVRTVGKHKNDRIIAINDQLKKLERKGNYTYIELHSFFVDSTNSMKSEYSRDGVHLNYNGYKLWFNLIEPYLTP